MFLFSDMLIAYLRSCASEETLPWSIRRTGEEEVSIMSANGSPLVACTSETEAVALMKRVLEGEDPVSSEEGPVIFREPNRRQLVAA